MPTLRIITASSMGNTPTKPTKEVVEEVTKEVAEEVAEEEQSYGSDIKEAPADVLDEMEFDEEYEPPTHKFDIQWDQRLEQLREYKSDHGDCSVPMKSEVYGTLGKVSDLRMNR